VIGHSECKRCGSRITRWIKSNDIIRNKARHIWERTKIGGTKDEVSDDKD